LCFAFPKTEIPSYLHARGDASTSFRAKNYFLTDKYPEGLLFYTLTKKPSGEEDSISGA
jgi:hypothetical protein